MILPRNLLVSQKLFNTSTLSPFVLSKFMTGSNKRMLLLLTVFSKSRAERATGNISCASYDFNMYVIVLSEQLQLDIEKKTLNFKTALDTMYQH